MQSPAPTIEFSTDDVKLSAVALAAGGKLRTATPAERGRLLFTFDGLPKHFGLEVENGNVVLPARDFIRCMESILRIVAQHQRADWRR